MREYMKTRGAKKKEKEKREFLEEIVTYGHALELNEFIIIYINYSRSVNRVIDLEEADEILIQIAMIGGCEAIRKINSIIKRYAKKNCMKICKQHFNLIEAGVIPLFPLIVECIKFQHQNK